MTLALMTVRQEVNNFEISVVVQELEFAMNLALYGLQYIVGNHIITGKQQQTNKLSHPQPR